MKTEIIKVVTPLHRTYYVALVKQQFLFFYRWVSVKYYPTLNEIAWSWHSFHEFEYETEAEAKRAIEIYRLFKQGKKIIVKL